MLVRVEAAPINPSDLGLLFGAADMSAAVTSGSGEQPVITAPVPERIRAMAGRLGQPMPVGNEGAGVVAKSGSSAAAQSLNGKKVAMLGGQCMLSIVVLMLIDASNSLMTYRRQRGQAAL